MQPFIILDCHIIGGLLLRMVIL